MYFHRASLGPVDLAFTDRYGGVSAVPYDELNLALGGADDPAAVEENLRRVLTDFAPGATTAQMQQVHGCEVDVVDDWRGNGLPEADALVSTQPEVVLVVRVADCVPVLLADPGTGIIGVAHAGRAGMAAGVVPATVARMRDLGAQHLTAWVGPHICGRCYEVPAELRDEVGAIEPAALATTAWGSPALDVGAGVCAQLARAEVRTHVVPGCTRELPELYSYRRDGASAGRLAGLIRVRR